MVIFYLLAAIFIVSWAIAFFAFGAAYIVHLLLLGAILSLSIIAVGKRQTEFK